MINNDHLFYPQFMQDKERESRIAAIESSKIRKDTPVATFVVDQKYFDVTPPQKMALDNYLSDTDIMELIQATYEYSRDWAFWAKDFQVEAEYHFSRPYPLLAQHGLGYEQ